MRYFHTRFIMDACGALTIGRNGFADDKPATLPLTGASILPVVECAKLLANRFSGRLARRGKKDAAS
jgi:hypothetical protein